MVKNLTEIDVFVNAQKICRVLPCILGAQIVTDTDLKVQIGVGDNLSS